MKSSQLKILQSKFTGIEIWSIILLVLLSFTGISVAQIGKAMLTPWHLCMGFMMSYGLLVSRKADKKISLRLLTNQDR